MNGIPISNTHWSFWTISSIALTWNILGGINFIMQMDVDVVSAMPETARAIIEGRPGWATAGFSISVFGGALAACCLAQW